MEGCERNARDSISRAKAGSLAFLGVRTELVELMWTEMKLPNGVIDKIAYPVQGIGFTGVRRLTGMRTVLIPVSASQAQSLSTIQFRQWA